MVAAIAMVALTAVGSVPACAQGKIRVDWVRAQGAEVCPDGHAFAGAVTAELGCAAFGEAPALRFEALITRADVGWAAHVSTRDAGGALLGRRVLESREERCRVLADAVALTIAVMAENLVVDTTTVAVTKPTTLPPPIEPVAARVVFVKTGTPAEAADAPPARGVGQLSLALNAGTMPNLRFGAQVGTGWRPIPRLHIGAGALLFPIQRRDDLGFGLFAGWTEACYRLSAGALDVALCGRVLAGAYQVIVYPGGELRLREPGSFVWAAVSGAARAAIRMWGPVYLEAEAGPLVSLSQRQWDVDNGETAFKEAPLAFLGAVGVALRFE